ncbi:MAG: hypothetical protein GY719_16470 [bacterium]|nr:hypothetical protein [bacterium]
MTSKPSLVPTRRFVPSAPMIRAACLLVIAALAASRSVSAVDPFGVTSGGVPWPGGSVLLKLTNPQEIEQNQARGAEVPDDDFQVLFYNTAMLPRINHVTNHIGMWDRWDLLDNAILDASNAEAGAGYDVLVLGEMFDNTLAGVSRRGFGPDPMRDLFGNNPGFGVDNARSNNRYLLQTRLWDLGWKYQSKAPGGPSQTEDDGAVIIASRWPIEAMDEFVFTDCVGSVITQVFGGGTSDCSARKGAIHARINKNGQRYHVIGTHLQASAFNSDGSPHADWPDYVAARASQLQEIQVFIQGLALPWDEPLFIGGDMNIDFGTGEYQDMLSTLTAYAPPASTRTGRMYTFDAVTNDLTPVTAGAEPASWLDHAVISSVHRRPVSARTVITPIRRSGGWVNGANGNTFHHDLSDHHAFLLGTTLRYSRDTGPPFLALATESPDLFVGRTGSTEGGPLSRYAYARLLAGDFNRDGKTDIAQIEVPEPGSGPSQEVVRVLISDGAGGFVASDFATWRASTHFQYLTGDFNRDVNTDLLRVEMPRPGQMNADLHVGTSTAGTSAFQGTFATSKWATRFATLNDRFFTGDFTGDGYTDVLHVGIPASGWDMRDLWVGVNMSPAGSDVFSDQGDGPWGVDWHTSPTNMEILIGDFDGDGKSDVLKIDLPSSGCSRLGFWVGTSRQDPSGRWSFTAEGDHANGEWTRPTNCKDSRYFTGDFDHDGRTDVAWVRFDNADPETHADRDVYVGLSRPSTSQPGKHFFWVARSPYRLRVNRHAKIFSGDFNGDRFSDLLALLVPDRGEGRSCMGMRALYGQPTGLFGPETPIRNGGSNPCPSSFFWRSYRQLKVLTGDFDVDSRTDLFMMEVPFP